MLWLEATLVGIVVGGVGGIWLLLSLTAIHSRLRAGKPPQVGQLAALLTLPTFEGGGTWAAHNGLGGALGPEVLVAYLLSSTLLILAINTLPFIRVVTWCARHIEGAP